MVRVAGGRWAMPNAEYAARVERVEGVILCARDPAIWRPELYRATRV